MKAQGFKLLYLFFGIGMFAQPNTEVYLVDLEILETGFSSTNFINVSNNDGYDNQPSFYDDNILTFAKNRTAATDIAVFSTFDNSTTWFHSETEGGEYSPQRIPNTNHIAAVRLDPDGKQRLHVYIPGGLVKEAIQDLKVAYYTFYNEHQIVASILSDDRLDLVIADLDKGEVFSYLTHTGRSIHKVPKANSVSYTTINGEGNHDVYVANFEEDGESFFVCQLPIGVQDYVWLNDSTLLVGSGAKLYLYDLFGSGDWVEVLDFSEENIQNITRLAVSPNGKKLAFVAEPNTK